MVKNGQNLVRVIIERSLDKYFRFEYLQNSKVGHFYEEVLSCATWPFGFETRPVPVSRSTKVSKPVPLLQRHQDKALFQKPSLALQVDRW